MSNHPNRSKSAPPTAAATPTPDELRAWRRATGLSAAKAGALVHVTGRAWQRWEAGERPMHPAFFELARAKRDRPAHFGLSPGDVSADER